MLSIIATIANYTLSNDRGRIIKTVMVFVSCFGILLVAGKLFGLNFLGIKYILYYSVFYGFGWLTKWTQAWWEKIWGKLSNIVYFICLFVFLGVVFNFDLYHTDDGFISIAMRAIAGFTGNAVLLAVCTKHKKLLSMVKLDLLGMYTLEIYTTHMCVNNLMEMGKGFFTAAGFGNFICSLILTVLFTTIIIGTFKAIPATDFIFYGKRK